MAIVFSGPLASKSQVHLAWGRQLYAGQLTVEQFIGQLAVEQFIGQLTVEQFIGQLAVEQFIGQLAVEQFIWPGVDSCMQDSWR